MEFPIGDHLPFPPVHNLSPPPHLSPSRSLSVSPCCCIPLCPRCLLRPISQEPARREFLKASSAAAAAVVFSSSSVTVLPAFALDVPDQVTAYEFPSDWGLSFKYDEDAAKVRDHMLLATTLAKGADRMEDYGKNMKKEMVDFVSYYRRFPQIAGKPSFSTLYTAINVLAGHYTSYGYKYPLPEKRRKRLFQEYAEIAKSLKRGR